MALVSSRPLVKVVEPCLNPLTAPVRKFSGMKSARVHALKQDIWWAYNKPTLVLCVSAEVLSRTHAERRNSLNDFKSGTSIDRLSSDGAANTTVKGLKPGLSSPSV